MKTHLKLRWICCSLVLIASTHEVSGQTMPSPTPAPETSPAPTSTTAPAATPTPAPSTGSGGSMDTIVVNGVPIEQNIMPTSRPVNSVFGLDMSVLDTPRNATIISREQLSQVDIQDARDYSKLTSDAFTESDFGTPATPAIRGQPADVFINGMRSGWNADGNGPPVDFNNIESVNIVKGPPDSVYGTSVFVGGYVDEITKRPYFDKFQGDASATIGEYDQFRQSLDFGGPIMKDQLAYRVSYSGNESGSYYNYVHNDSQYGYGALSWIPSEKYSLDFNASFGEVDYLENNGINRVTQALIDNGTYITGQAPGVNGTGAQGGFFNFYAPTGTTDLSRSTNVRNPQDGAYAQTFNMQAIQTVTPDDDLKIVNNTFYQYLYWRTYNSQFYDQLSDGDYSVENRLSFQLNSDFVVIDPTTGSKMDSKDMKDMKQMTVSDPGLTFHNELNAGFDFRFQHNTDYESIASEPFNIYDLTQNPNTIFDQIPPSSYGAFGVAHIPGLPQKYVFDDAGGDSGKSNEYQGAVFFEDVLHFTPQWALLTGARADIIHVDAQSAPGTPDSLFLSDSTTQVLPDLNASITYKPYEWMTVYGTVNYSQAPGNTQQSGVFTPQQLNASYFHENATLFEMGAKFSLIKDKLYTTATVYESQHYDPASGGSSYRERSKGVELEANYQPDKHFYATAGYSYFNSVDINPGFQYNVTPEDKNLAGGVINADNPSFLLPGGGLNGYYKSPGFPTNSWNALAVYKFDCGIGASYDVQVTDPMNVAWVGGVHIPWQYNMDASLFYTYKQSEVKLSVYNFTNTKNWGTVNPIYGLDSIYAEEPIHVEGTIKIHF